jgi:hypothetical protein
VAEIKFILSVNVCTIMDKIRNEEIRKELEIFSVQVKRKDSKFHWLNIIREQALEKYQNRHFICRPQGRRDFG